MTSERDHGSNDKVDLPSPRTDAALDARYSAKRAFPDPVVVECMKLEHDLAAAERRYSELELTSSAAISALVANIEKAERPTARSAGTRTVANPVKDADLFICCADGEGSHEFRVCHGYEGVAAFYQDMCGFDADGTTDSLKRTFDDPDEWRNDGAMLELELYCAKFSVWKVNAAELAMPGFVQSASEPFLTDVCDELFGCFLDHGGEDGYRCAICERSIPIGAWVHAAHDEGCIIPKVREYLAQHRPSSVPPKENATMAPADSRSHK